LQGSQVAPGDRDETLFSAVTSEDDLQGKRQRAPVVRTHIIIGAVVAKHGDTPAVKLYNENGQGVECHGWEKTESLPFALDYPYSIISHQTKFKLRRPIERLLYGIYSMLCAAVPTPCCLADPLESGLGPWVLGTVQREREYVLDPRWRQVVHGVFL
jgi:hypothetical protein